MSNYLPYITPAGLSPERFSDPKSADFPIVLPDPMVVDPSIWRSDHGDRTERKKDGSTIDAKIDEWLVAVGDNNVEQRRSLVLDMTEPGNKRYPYAASDIYRFASRIYGLSKDSSFFADKPEVAEEIAACIMYWQDNTHSVWHESSMVVVNTYIQLAATVLPYASKQTGEAIVQSMPIIDPEVFWSPDDGSGYGPAESLLYDEHVPYGYKRIILARWFGQVVAEYTGVSKPREDWEAAGKNLISFLNSYTYRKSITQDDRLFASVINFFETKLQHPGHYAVSYDVGNLAPYIHDRTLLVRFLAHHIDKELSFDDAVNKLNLSDGEKEDLRASISEQKSVFEKERRQAIVTVAADTEIASGGKLRRAWRAFWKEIAGPPPDQR